MKHLSAATKGCLTGSHVEASQRKKKQGFVSRNLKRKKKKRKLVDTNIAQYLHSEKWRCTLKLHVHLNYNRDYRTRGVIFMNSRFKLVTIL